MHCEVKPLARSHTRARRRRHERRARLAALWTQPRRRHPRRHVLRVAAVARRRARRRPASRYALRRAPPHGERPQEAADDARVVGRQRLLTGQRLEQQYRLRVQADVRRVPEHGGLCDAADGLGRRAAAAQDLARGCRAAQAQRVRVDELLDAHARARGRHARRAGVRLRHGAHEARAQPRRDVGDLLPHRPQRRRLLVSRQRSAGAPQAPVLRLPRRVRHDDRAALDLQRLDVQRERLRLPAVRDGLLRLVVADVLVDAVAEVEAEPVAQADADADVVRVARLHAQPRDAPRQLRHRARLLAQGQRDGARARLLVNRERQQLRRERGGDAAVDEVVHVVVQHGRRLPRRHGHHHEAVVRVGHRRRHHRQAMRGRRRARRRRARAVGALGTREACDARRRPHGIVVVVIAAASAAVAGACRAVRRPLRRDWVAGQELRERCRRQGATALRLARACAAARRRLLRWRRAHGARRAVGAGLERRHRPRAVERVGRRGAADAEHTRGRAGQREGASRAAVAAARRRVVVVVAAVVVAARGADGARRG
mmetsp:Transcript_26161/g.91005  ORF Transcript_26161/g.91005 Transcript_26161/m.91005 type:complete len:544 (-) Transcript_26161:449-2080(-)